MDINEFIDKIREQFDDMPSEITPQTAYADLDGWSSLVALSVISMIDEEYGVQVTGSEIRSAETVQELFEIVKGKKS